MAFVPDEAVIAGHSVSSGAFFLYVYFCMRRNRQSGGFRCPWTLVDRDVGLPKTTYYRQRAELRDAGWIEVDGDFVRPLNGNFNLKNGNSNPKNGIANPKNGTAYIETIPATIPATDHVGSFAAGGGGTEARLLAPKRGDGSAGHTRSNAEGGAAVEEVFEYWKFKTGNAEAILDPKRTSLLGARLQEGYTVERLKRCLDGWALNPFYQGKNRDGNIIDSILTIFANGDRVEKFENEWKKSLKSHSVRTAGVGPAEERFCDRCREHSGRYLIEIDGQVRSHRCDHNPHATPSQPPTVRKANIPEGGADE